MGGKNRYAKKILNKSLELLRKALGLNQCEAAEKVGVSRQYIQKIETSTHGISVSGPFFESFCRTLKTTEEWLKAGAGWSYNPTTVSEALQFVNGCLKLKPSAVTIVAYRDDNHDAKGLVFIGPFGTVSISGSYTSCLSVPVVTFVQEEILRAIKAEEIVTNYISLDSKTSERLSQTDLTVLAKAEGGRK